MQDHGSAGTIQLRDGFERATLRLDCAVWAEDDGRTGKFSTLAGKPRQ